MDAVPLKATTTLPPPQLTIHRVSCLVSHRLSLSVKSYRLMAVSSRSTVLAPEAGAAVGDSAAVVLSDDGEGVSGGGDALVTGEG